MAPLGASSRMATSSGLTENIRVNSLAILFRTSSSRPFPLLRASSIKRAISAAGEAAAGPVVIFPLRLQETGAARIINHLRAEAILSFQPAQPPPGGSLSLRH